MTTPGILRSAEPVQEMAVRRDSDRLHSEIPCPPKAFGHLADRDIRCPLTERPETPWGAKGVDVPGSCWWLLICREPRIARQPMQLGGYPDVRQRCGCPIPPGSTTFAMCSQAALGSAVTWMIGAAPSHGLR